VIMVHLSSVLDKLAAAINPFFPRYTCGKLLGLIVGLAMVGGFISLTIVNLRCEEVVSIQSGYDTVSANWAGHKLFVDNLLHDPPDLPETAVRDVNVCIAGVLTRNDQEFSVGQTTIQEALVDICLLPPNSFYDATNFPNAFKTCQRSALGDMGGAATVGGLDAVVGHANWEDAVFDIGLQGAESSFPGYRCKWASAVSEWAGDCANRPSDHAERYVYCGYSRNPQAPFYDSSTWTDYGDLSTVFRGTTFSLIYQYQITTTERVCPTVTSAIGSAQGLVSSIELVVTLIVATILIKLGYGKPKDGSVPSITDVVKGPGLFQVFERVEALEKKQARAESSKESIALSA